MTSPQDRSLGVCIIAVKLANPTEKSKINRSPSDLADKRRALPSTCNTPRTLSTRLSQVAIFPA